MSAREDDLAAIAMQESELCFERFDEDVAWSLGSRLRTMAVARKAGVVIDIRRFEQPLFYCALAGTTPDNAESGCAGKAISLQGFIAARTEWEWRWEQACSKNTHCR